MTDVPSVVPLKQRAGLSPELSSCHTALVGEYVIEGHVPGSDIKRMLAEGPDIRGLAVPGMPIGSPGSEQGSRRDPFQVILFSSTRLSVFATYPERNDMKV